jgi:hypothetical protein
MHTAVQVLEQAVHLMMMMMIMFNNMTHMAGRRLTLMLLVQRGAAEHTRHVLLKKSSRATQSGHLI